MMLPTAIKGEKQLKRRRREKKMWLIEAKNPGRKDLAADRCQAETQSSLTAALVA